MSLSLKGQLDRIAAFREHDTSVVLEEIGVKLYAISEDTLNFSVYANTILASQMRTLKAVFGPVDFAEEYVGSSSKVGTGTRTLDIVGRPEFETLKLKLIIYGALACKPVKLDATGPTDAQMRKLREQLAKGYVKLSSCEPVDAVEQLCLASECCDEAQSDGYCYNHDAPKTVPE